MCFHFEILIFDMFYYSENKLKFSLQVTKIKQKNDIIFKTKKG